MKVTLENQDNLRIAINAEYEALPNESLRFQDGRVYIHQPATDDGISRRPKEGTRNIPVYFQDRNNNDEFAIGHFELCEIIKEGNVVVGNLRIHDTEIVTHLKDFSEIADFDIGMNLWKAQVNKDKLVTYALIHSVGMYMTPHYISEEAESE